MSNLYEKPINELIPAGVMVTDIQKGYLEGVIQAMKTFKKDHVTYTEVGVVMRKDKSEVSSGIRPLMKKGILDINDDVEIVFVDHSGEEAAPAPAPAPAAKKTAAAKKTGTGKPAPKGKGGKAVFDDTLAFMLPSGYQMNRETDDDGNEKVTIAFGHGKDDNGNDTWEFNPLISTVEIVDAEDDKIPAGEKAVDTAIRRQTAAGGKSFVLQEKPKTALLMREAPINILGHILKFYVLMLCAEKDDHNIYTITSSKAWDEENGDVNLTHYQHMIDLIGAVRINGKALPGFDKDAEELMAEMMPDFEGKGSLIKGSIGVQIKNGDRVVSETRLVGDDEGNVHHIGEDGQEIEQIKDGKYGDLEIKDGWVRKCLKKAVSVEIPKGVTGIDDNAFEKCTKLEKVTIPDTVTIICSSAFSECAKLAKIHIPDSVTSVGMFAFKECKSLTEARLPEGIDHISMYTFCDCVKLEKVNIPSSVKTIYSSAFQGCESLMEITLPDGLEELNGDAFWGCKKLAKVNIPDGIKEIQYNTFYACGSLKDISIPNGVTAIGRSAFAGCVSLGKIEIPESVDEIGMYAFQNCKKLKKVKIPSGVTVIDENQFDGCENLTEVILPEALDSIKEYAFSECTKLKKCDIPAGVSEIEGGVFDECHALERVEIPEGVTEIPDRMCNNCKGLKEIVFHEAVETIGDYAFSGCGSLKGIRLPEALVKIGDGAFNECAGLTSVTIPDNVESIGRYAFDDCDSLKEVSMPAHEVELSAWALPDADQATIVYREADASKPAWMPKPKKRDPNMSDLEAACDALGCGCWNGSLTECRRKNIEEIEIPEGITEISGSVFANFTKLRSVKIPDTVTTIGMNAFKGCTALEEIEIPDSVTELQGWVFEDCAALKKVKLPAGITEIGYSLFRNCESLAEVEIPEGVKEIGDQAFNGCASLTEITLPDSIEKIGSWAFDNCTSLGTVYMPDKEIETEIRTFPAKAEIVKIPVGNSAAKAAAKQANSTERYTKVTPDDEIYSHYGKLKREHDKFSGMGIMHVSNNGTEHEAIPLTGLMERQGKTDNETYKKLKAIEKKDKYDLKELALKMAQVFRVDQSVFNARHDDEGEIGVTMLDKKWKFSALRSFAWTLADMADREGKSIEDYDTDELLGICRFIKKREWLNYEAGSWFDDLCGHNDIHVFYMPQQMIDEGSADAICDIFKFNPIVSLDAFRNDLATLKNPMIRLHNSILENRDRSVKLDSPEAAVLKAWCSLAMSAETAFFSEDGPMMFFHSYPEEPANTEPIPVGKKASAVKKAAPKAKKEEASAAMDSAGDYEVVKGPDGKNRIKLGNYPAGKPIVWLVLENNGSNLLLISEYGLDAKAFDDMSYTYEKTGKFGDSSNEWYNSTLRQWLNDEFLNAAFTDSEKEKILEDAHDTYKMSNTGAVEETGTVKDKVFLLSAREAKQYFPIQRELICKATEYAKQQGAEIENGPMQCHWWCRSPAVSLLAGMNGWTGCIMANGEGKGWGATTANVCVRPVIRIKADGVKNASAAPLSGKALAEKAEKDLKEIKETAEETLKRVQDDVASTKSALEKHAENLRKQEEEKEKRIKEAKARGKTDKDETDMLVSLLNEENLGFLDRAEDEFVEIYAEDFGAYNASQLKKLRKKVLPKIHDSDFIEAAKEDMLSRSVKDRFTISTGNWFNVSNHWSFREKGEMAIENTRQWYRDDELDEVRRLMEGHKKEACDSVDRQLTAFNENWNGFSGVKNDLHIDITETDEEASPKHSVFDVKLNNRLRVQILLKHPSMGFLTIPVMSLFASVWDVTPEQIWNAALNNTMDDARGVSARTKTDAQAAKTKALEQIRSLQPGEPAARKAAAPVTAEPVGDGTKREHERNALTNRIAALEKERDSLTGLFAGFKRKKLQNEIDDLKDQLRRL